MEFKVGDHFHMIQAGQGVKEYKCHILAIVDDDQIVYKWYGKHKQWWHYVVEYDWAVEMKIKAHKEWKKKNESV
jgi:uncharacterized protein YndB with AHSA1/START domain